MSAPSSPNEEELFSHAVDLPAADRAAYLDQGCAGDSNLRARVEALLRASAAAGRFMESPPTDAFAEAAKPGAPRVSETAVGDRIGRYKLLQKIGEGGCGVVYMAEQEEPVRRRVAVKVIKLGMDTKEVIARFEAERQALALMDHPNIARVLDAGATESGRPFFVMELVRGVPITKFCDEQKFSTAKRLELFGLVCHAVQHAHQKGIIHRDLKPSNILVTVNDAVPVPKVIDFGIAKATAGRLTDHTLFTAFEQFIGTPAYMSPEQAEMTSLDVDTRSDIYSLGVLLYELLTGRPPFDPKTLVAAGLDEIRRIIREVEPPRPSTRLNTLTDLDRTTIANQRDILPGQLSTLLRGDLDWIVMRCLEKDRTRRYETANGLALDVLRYLRDEPIVARPPSSAYRLQKLVRRNRVAFSAAAAMAATLVASTIFSAVQAVRARREAGRATRAEQVANQEAAISRGVSDFLTEDLLVQVASKKQGDMGYPPNPNLTVREALDRAANAVGDRFKDQPLTEAAVRTAIARAYGEISENRLALPQAERAFALEKGLRGAEHPVTLTAMHILAKARWSVQRDAEGAVLMAQTLELRKRVLGPEHKNTLESMKNLARMFNTLGKFAESATLLVEALEISRHTRGPNDPETLAAMNNLFHPYRGLGKYAEAEALATQTWELRKRVLGVEHPDTLATMFNVADGRALLGRRAEAAALFAENLEIRKRVLGAEHLTTLETVDYLGQNLIGLEKFAEAEAILRPLLASRRRLSPKGWITSATSVRLGEALIGLQRYSDAEPLLQEGGRGVIQHGAPDSLQDYAVSCVEKLYRAWNKPEQATEWQRKLAELRAVRNPAKAVIR